MEIIWGRFVEKTGGQKSRATVPLKVNSGEILQESKVVYSVCLCLMLIRCYFFSNLNGTYL
jgi:hypothetical protein